ncbi:MAG: hypothetical protein AAB116_02640 [Candidatus Poribacteria bacterium]
MDNLKEKENTNTGTINISLYEPEVFFDGLDVETIESEYQGFSIIESATTIVSLDENFVNEERLTLLKKQYTRELIALILDEDFEYGFDTKADVLVRSQMQLNALAVKSWLNWIFVENFSNIPVLLGILRIIARFDYREISPEGQTMAGMALSHENVEVKECGVRAFESWGTVESLKELEKLKVSTQWLQEYIDEVVSDLRKEYNVHICQENR